MRKATTIADLQELFEEYAVIPVLDGNRVYLCMPDGEEWEPTSFQLGQVYIRSQAIIPTDPVGVQFQRTANNAILALVNNPQFTRKTTVASQVTEFYGADKGSFPPMFMQGTNRRPSDKWLMTGMTKKASEEFTIHFFDAECAQIFIQLLTDGNYYSIQHRMILKVTP